MKLIYKIMIPVFLVLGSLMILVIFFFSNAFQSSLIQEEFFRIQDGVNKNQDALLPLDFGNPSSLAAADDFQSFFGHVADPSVARFTIWNKDQKAIFSDLSEIVGQELKGS